MITSIEAAVRRFSSKYVIKSFKIFTGKHLCWSLFLIKLQLYSIETPTQLFFCVYCDICNNVFFHRIPW